MDEPFNDTDQRGNPEEESERSQSSENTTSPEEETTTLPEYTMNDLPEALRDAFVRQGWTDLMPVQARAIPYILANRDLMIQSRTGSGKTGAYLVPILQNIRPEVNACQALILTPTRELALQVTHEAEVLSSAMDVRVVAVYGGVGYGQQLEAFRSGAHLVIGTPGRILDHLLRRSLSLNKLRILVFDEADRMLSMGFYPDMKRLQSFMPDHPINTYMFSATYPPRVLALAREFMRKPEIINLSSDHVHVTETEHIFYNVPAMDKERSLLRILELENPASALIFANTRERVHFINVILQRYGYNSAEISSDLSQGAREEVMQRIRERRLRFLVATDVAARGIDLPELSHVLLYEPPDDPEDYIHRAGRTGRAGGSGVAISLVNALEKAELLRIARRYEIDLQERPVPTDEEMQQVVVQRTIALLEARLRTRDRIQAERMQRFLPFLHSMADGEDDEVLASFSMLLDDFYHDEFHTAQLPAIEGQTRQEPVRRSSEGRRGSRRRDSQQGRRSSGGREERPRPARDEQGAPKNAPGESSEQSRPTGERGSGPPRRRKRGSRGGRRSDKPSQPNPKE